MVVWVQSPQVHPYPQGSPGPWYLVDGLVAGVLQGQVHHGVL